MGEDGNNGVVEENSVVTSMEIDVFRSPNIRLLKCESEGSPTGEAEVHLVGTNHLSKLSCDEVRDLIQRVRPEVVFLELCEDRSDLLEPMDLKETYKSRFFSWWNSTHDPFSTLYIHLFAKVGAELETSPGEEFRVAAIEADNCEAEIVLGDRPVQVTVLRLWGRLSFWQKMKIFGTLIRVVLWMPKKEELKEEMDRIISGDVSAIFSEFGKEFPELSETLITERDMFMSVMLRRVAKKKKNGGGCCGKRTFIRNRSKLGEKRY